MSGSCQYWQAFKCLIYIYIPRKLNNQLRMVEDHFHLRIGRFNMMWSCGVWKILRFGNQQSPQHASVFSVHLFDPATSSSRAISIPTRYRCMIFTPWSFAETRLLMRATLPTKSSPWKVEKANGFVTELGSIWYWTHIFLAMWHSIWDFGFTLKRQSFWLRHPWARSTYSLQNRYKWIIADLASSGFSL